ncbi:MAG: HlyD family efflux transporter periplasmic adaptor subunit [Burkholderiaceae bacterium]
MNEEQAMPSSPSPNGRRRKLLLGVLALAVVVVAAGWGVRYYTHGRWIEETDDAYASGNVVQITPQIPGTIVAIGADDNQFVKAGQSLVRLDPSDAEVAVAQAEAALASSVRQVRGLYSNVGSLDAEVTARQVALDRAKADLGRRQDLAASGAIAAEELAHAREAYAAAASALSAARQQAATSRALVDDTAVDSHPEVRAAASALRKGYLDLARAELQSPVSGYVARRSAQLGQRVQAGAPLMAVVPLDQLWVDANFKETQLRRMRIGQPVVLHADLYGDDVVYHGQVQGLGVGTGSAFSLLPAQNATGNWIKIVQRVPVRIALSPDELREHPLKIGLSMRVEVDMHDRSGAVLAQAADDRPPIATDVYERRIAEADQRIRHIIDENNGPRRGAGRDARPPAGDPPVRVGRGRQGARLGDAIDAS